MTMKVKKNILLALLTVIIATGIITTTTCYAEIGKTSVAGKVYTFDKKSSYEFSDQKEYEDATDDNTFGSFSISGNISNVSTKNNVPSYELRDGTVDIFYSYSNAMSETNVDEWHIIEDKTKKIDSMKLDDNILKGAIIIQTSNDMKNWVDVKLETNVFADNSIITNSLYTCTDVEIINGCYYRVIVAYELSIRTEKSNILFINTDKYDYKKVVEVYEFYACVNESDNDTVDNTQTYNLGNKVKVDDFDCYYGEKTINKKDVHYGWNLGEFFVSGYTDEVKDDKDNMVFLKNVGDKVTLWFRLEQNIDKLNGNDKLSITADKAGSDQYFETPTMNFGRGVLIIRYTDYKNVQAEPIIYTNYLEANAVVGADTKVQLFEEGDYEVALDYEITNNQLIDAISHYRIFFKFSIRNSNCMVYPFDTVTGSELTNSSMTENGFYLDLAKSRYLQVSLKREVLSDSADGLVEDTRFNGLAKDGDIYTDEGIYTITVYNRYTEQLTTKKIYVGSNNIIKAYMTTGLPISDINALVSQGATISNDGTIFIAETDKNDITNDSTPSINTDSLDNSSKESTRLNVELLIIILIIIGILHVIILGKKKGWFKKG